MLSPEDLVALRIDLDGTTVPVRRELVVRADTVLPELTEYLIYAMGWNNTHIEVSQVLFRLSRWENLEYAKKI